MQLIDAASGYPFWYNEDTGAATFDTPHIVQAREEYRRAVEFGFSDLSLNLTTLIFEFLLVRGR